MSVRAELTNRPRVPAILISVGTQQLLEDVLDRRDLMRGLPRIRRRVVAWGSGDVVTVAHSGCVISEDELLRRIGPTDQASGDTRTPAWTIHTGRAPAELGDPPETAERITTITRVRLTSQADSEACLMESGTEGWLFLLPAEDRSAWLLSTGSGVSELLAESRLVRNCVDVPLETRGSFPSHPRIANSLCGEGWLACGSAALRFDPLCGDGAGHAVREAVLACAMISHTDPATISDQLLWEYRLRMWRGYRRHIELCLQYYSTGGQGEWWRAQCASLRTELHRHAELHSSFQLGTFRLNGFTLERV